ncbi:MAG: hypothetical protein FJ265_04370 [Planctomycetes bacterium]|nr:hypothetical protein [Planctomycetota bacterium]
MNLREMDLYKVLILICLVALPVCGWWCYAQQQEIEACRKAITEAGRPGGLVEQIGSLQKKVEIVANNRISGNDIAIQQPRMYLEQQIMASARQNLTTSDFSIADPKEETVSLGGKQQAVDYVAEVTWKNKALALPLEFLWAVMWNCESSARPGSGTASLQPIWKLRELKIANSTNERLLNSYEPPPAELEDKWKIDKMSFARREPKRAGK